MKPIQIVTPKTFTDQHQVLLTRYLRDDRSLKPGEWRELYTAMDILSNAHIYMDNVTQTFRQVFARQVEARFAPTYLEQLVTSTDLERQSPSLIADFAHQIAPHLQKLGLLRTDASQTWLFYVYCVYWWQNFARGYAFEIQIMRDLQTSGITFDTHNILDPSERRSVADLIVLDMLGDVKTSTYFLHQATGRKLPADFYITRLWTGRRHHLLVVFQKPAAWEKIDGDTLDGELYNLLSLLPKPVRICQDKVTLVVVDYEDWKRRVLRIQLEEAEHERDSFNGNELC